MARTKVWLLLGGGLCLGLALVLLVLRERCSVVVTLRNDAQRELRDVAVLVGGQRCVARVMRPSETVRCVAVVRAESPIRIEYSVEPGRSRSVALPQYVSLGLGGVIDAAVGADGAVSSSGALDVCTVIR